MTTSGGSFKTIWVFDNQIGEDSDAKNRLLLLDLKDNRIGKFIVGDELLKTIPIDKIASLTHFLC